VKPFSTQWLLNVPHASSAGDKQPELSCTVCASAVASDACLQITVHVLHYMSRHMLFLVRAGQGQGAQAGQPVLLAGATQRRR
jgi:hypothetical protein